MMEVAHVLEATVHDVFCLPSQSWHGLVSRRRDEKHDLPLGMDERRGGPPSSACSHNPSPSINKTITALFADVVIGALSVVRL
jgi:hypothetical protein